MMRNSSILLDQRQSNSRFVEDTMASDNLVRSGLGESFESS